MSTMVKRKEGIVRVKEYITDTEGHKVAAVIDMIEKLTQQKYLQLRI